MQKFLIIGLGNIGAEYAHTRHNIGFDIADAFVQKHQGIWQMDRLAFIATLKLKGRQVIVAKPTTYMNLSGRAFKYWMDKEKIDLANTLTLLDDLALPLEKIRVRPSGSHAGHNGLRSIEACVGSQAYPRLRFGIGNNFSKGKQADFVLSPWLPNELPLINQKIETCTQLLADFVLQGLEPVMNTYNKLHFNSP